MKKPIIFAFLILVSLFLVSCTPKNQNILTQNDTLDNLSELQNIGNKENAEQRAQAFAIATQDKDYAKLYSMLIPGIQKDNSKTIFIANMQSWESILIYDKVILDEKNISAYAYYTVSFGSTQQKMPPLEMEWVDGNWYFNAFAKMGQVKSNQEVTTSETTKNQVEEDLPELHLEYFSCREDESTGWIKIDGKIYNKDVTGRSARDVKVYVDVLDRGKIVAITEISVYSIKPLEHKPFNDYILDDVPSRWDKCNPTVVQS